MRKHTLAIYETGKEIILSTDDTFTLAIGDMENDPDWLESTPSQLMQLFHFPELHRLYESGNCDEAEKSKLRRALQIN